MQSLKSTKVLVSLAVLVAISIVLGKYLAIGIGEVLRFSMENLPVLFAGIAFGPVAGALVGAVADLIGCLMVGFTINPVVTVGAAVIGAVGGLVPLILSKRIKGERLIIAITVSLAHLIGSVLIKTFGLSAYYDMPFIILMLWRLLNYTVVGGIEGVLLYTLFNSKGIRRQLSLITEDKK